MVTIPNMITIGRICLVPVFVVVFYLPTEHRMQAAAAIFIIAALTDYLDGYVARRLKQETKAGAILDPLADKLIILTALVMMTGKGVPYIVTAIILFRELLITGIRALREAEPMVKARFLGKLKMASQIIAVTMALLALPHSLFMLWIATALTVISGADYVLSVLNPNR